MTSAVTQPTANPTDDPVRVALEDAQFRSGLLKHALAMMRRRLGGRPAVTRLDAAEGAVQDVCARALEKRDGYNADRPLRPWLHGIMTNVVKETVRGEMGLPVQESANAAAWEKLAVDLSPDIAETVPNRLDAAGYLAKLPAEIREVITLRYYEGLSHEQIAAKFGISAGNARVKLCRALSALKAIAGCGQEGRP
jgi:RNA polymerase sigma factor (sigma-70 family)